MSDHRSGQAYETVDVRRHGAAATIELNRPEAMNALNEQLGRDLLAAVEAAGSDHEVRAVMLTGAGRAFSSGADLNEGYPPGADGRPDVRARLETLYHPIILGLRRMPKPVVAAVNGPAVGIGCSLALASDLVVAAESAYFLLAFVNIGLVPDGGSSVFLPARIGHARTVAMAMLGESVPARQALEWGMVNRVVADGELPAEADSLLQRLAGGPTRSYAGTKRQLNARVYAGLEEQLELEAEIQQETARSDDFAEGVLAFIQKRTPAFRNR